MLRRFSVGNLRLAQLDRRCWATYSIWLGSCITGREFTQKNTECLGKRYGR